MSIVNLNDMVQNIIDCFPKDGLKRVQKLMGDKGCTFSVAVVEFFDEHIKGV